MKVYTKTGDNGKTSLGNNDRVLKSDFQVASYGVLDELTSFIGLVVFKLKNKKDKEFLINIQKDLYKVMSFLAVKKQEKKEKNKLEGQVKKIEKYIDSLEKKLPKLNSFILPFGSELSCWFHILRTITRRAERVVVRFFSHQPADSSQQLIAYLNRLSDLFFMLSRVYNKEKEEIIFRTRCGNSV